MTTKDQLKSMYIKLNQWNEFLGGDKQGNPNKKDSEFDSIKNSFLKVRYETQKLLQKKQQTTKASELGALSFEIRKQMDVCKQLIQKLEAQQKRQITKNKLAAAQIEHQQKIVENCQALYQDLQDRNKSNTSRQPRQNVQTLTQLKTKLLKQIDIESHRIQKMGSQDSFFNTDGQGMLQQKQAMDEFEANDKIIDDRMGGVIDRIQGLKQQARNIGMANDQIHKKVVKNKQAVTRVTKNIKTQNQKLKVIIQKFKPANCCLTMVFILLLIGLIVVVVNMVLNK